ncbi:MAG: adenosylcobinamide-GDP ribazoletransferase [Bacillota bacterium]|nr:adenosylcobinamide-GDP ribazoletransferase [Bacillota bacterium]
MKEFFLLLSKMTFMPVPRRIKAADDSLPRALRLLPLLGLLCGALLYLAARLFVVMPASGAAAMLVAINVMLGGGVMLRDLVTVADGLTAKRLPPNMAVDYGEYYERPNYRRLGRAGKFWGVGWLLFMFFIYYCFYRFFYAQFILLIPAQVFSRWIMCWLVYSYPAVFPGWLHREFSKNSFIFSTGLALAIIVPFSSLTLYSALLAVAAGIYLFAVRRLNAAGALDDGCYGAAVAWGEILFLAVWLSITLLLKTI